MGYQEVRKKDLFLPNDSVESTTPRFLYFTAGAFFHGRAKAGERRADDNVAARSLYGGNERVDERRGLGGGLIRCV